MLGRIDSATSRADDHEKRIRALESEAAVWSKIWKVGLVLLGAGAAYWFGGK